jgi:hypothetical protein
MDHAVDKVQQDYWRPVAEHRTRELMTDARGRSEVCSGCGSEFIVGARYCHVCGGGRTAETAASWSKWVEAMDFDRIRHSLGLSTGSLVAFIFGVVAVCAAVAVGFIYSANTLVDWQAVQTWRIEWMLAAIVAFVAGILLKRSENISHE